MQISAASVIDAVEATGSNRPRSRITGRDRMVTTVPVTPVRAAMFSSLPPEVSAIELSWAMAVASPPGELGATVVEEHDEFDIQWTVLRDVEGNEFCVATTH